MAKDSKVQGGASVSHWGASHNTGDGRLISRQTIVEVPVWSPCLTLTCMKAYFKAQVVYVLTLLYHQYRVEYAEKFRDNDIPTHYRTGENAPTTFWGLVWAIMRIPHG